MDGSGDVELLKPYPAHEMKAYEVSTRVNSVRNNDPEWLTLPVLPFLPLIEAIR
jgi:putative SOS response-associated peptidase YedK